MPVQDMFTFIYLNVQEGRNISLNGLVFKCNDGHIINDILNLITVNFVLVWDQNEHSFSCCFVCKLRIQERKKSFKHLQMQSFFKFRKPVPIKQGFIGVLFTPICWEKGWNLHINIVNFPQNRVLYIKKRKLQSILWIPVTREALWRYILQKKGNVNSKQSVLNVTNTINEFDWLL